MRGSRRAAWSSMAPEPSREPSSMAMTSYSVRVWRASDASDDASQGAASRTGRSTEIRGVERGDMAPATLSDAICYCRAGELARARGSEVRGMAGRRLLILGGGFGGLDVARAVGDSHAARGYWDTLLV